MATKGYIGAAEFPGQAECVRVIIKAKAVNDNGNGTFSIHIPARRMAQSEREMLEHLFPNTVDKVYKLLDVESLIDSLATDAEITQLATKK